MYRDRTSTRCYLGFGIRIYSDGNLAQLNARQKRFTHFTPWIDVTMWQCASKCTPQQNSTPCKLSTSPVEHLFHTLHFLHDLVGNMESGWVWMSLDESGWVRMSLDESGWVWMSPDESGWVRMSLDESGWVWMSLDESGWVWMSLDESGHQHWSKIETSQWQEIIPPMGNSWEYTQKRSYVFLDSQEPCDGQVARLCFEHQARPFSNKERAYMRSVVRCLGL